MIEAKVVCDSIGKYSSRLTTFQLRYPKFVHGEFMTHRMFSRNASSSRAIPVSKNLAEVRSDRLRATPVWWGKEQKGMQSGEECTNLISEIDPNIYWGDPCSAKKAWGLAAETAASFAEAFQAAGYHKSIVNRILEPFLHINVVATSCEPGLMNFFGLRLDKAAQPEIRVLAEQMWAAWNENNPQKLELGQWHLPFADDLETKYQIDLIVAGGLDYELWLSTQRKVSVARCARVSYLSFETNRRSTVEEDLALYNRLINAQPGHFSPTEHQATPDEFISEYAPDFSGQYDKHYWKSQHLHGNLPGWIQYRKTLPNESVAPLPTEYL